MEDVMNVAFLGLGGNVGDALASISKAKELIEQACGTIQVQSSVYETEPWGLSSSNHFLNQVIQLKTHLSAEELIQKLLDIEAKLGRIRVGDGYSDRRIDIDILLFNDAIIASENLVVPHPRMHLRKFVLIPFNEVSGTSWHPTLHQSIHDLLLNCSDKSFVRVYKAE